MAGAGAGGGDAAAAAAKPAPVPRLQVSGILAFLQYNDAASSDNALKGLNGMKIGDSTLIVQKARPVEAGASSPFGPISHVLALSNMVTVDQLDKADFVQEMKEEVKEECAKF